MRDHPTRCHLVVALASALLLTGAAHADTWFPPKTESYSSADGAWRLTVIPRDIESPLAYFDDKVKGREPAGAVPGDRNTRARGSMEHLESDKWRRVWTGLLLNEVSPVSAIVSPSGRAVTFDNWHSMGYGGDAIVIYDDRGKVVRAMSLKDFLPADYLGALPRTVSSVHWGRDHHFSADGRRLVLQIVVPAMDMHSLARADELQFIELSFDLATGRALPRDAGAWSRALASVREVNEFDRFLEQRKAWFAAPLTAPDSDAEFPWHLYLWEAFFRLDRDWKDGHPSANVLRMPQHTEYQASFIWLREALRGGDPAPGDVIMIGSPSQDNLARTLAQIAPEIPRGSLRGKRIYVAVDDAHSAAVARALAHTGATYIQLDPGKPIPPRAERLKEYLERHP